MNCLICLDTKSRLTQITMWNAGTNNHWSSKRKNRVRIKKESAKFNVGDSKFFPFVSSNISMFRDGKQKKRDSQQSICYKYITTTSGLKC